MNRNVWLASLVGMTSDPEDQQLRQDSDAFAQPGLCSRMNVRFGSLADIGQPIRDVRFTPQKQTCSSSESMSAKCHQETCGAQP